MEKVRKILIVVNNNDDEYPTGNSLKEMLLKCGYLVYMACHGKDVVLLIKKYNIDLVLFDLCLCDEHEFLSVKSKLVKLRGIASKYSTTLTSLCLNLALDSSYINKIIVGVDSKENFDCILKDVSTCINLSKEDKEEIDCLREENESIILPYKWSKI